jgi:hypothetical protein
VLFYQELWRFLKKKVGKQQTADERHELEGEENDLPVFDEVERENREKSTKTDIGLKNHLYFLSPVVVKDLR